jgi:hypothetical protein
MFKNIENQHLSGEELRRLFKNPRESIGLNDHLKICAWCAERYREAVELILKEKIKSTDLFNTQSSEVTDN